MTTDLLLALLPLAALVALMTAPAPKLRLPMPAHLALPLCALIAYALQLRSAPDPGTGVSPALAVHAQIVVGLLDALTPLAIVFGAILLFTTMDRSGAMRVLTDRLRRLTPDPLAQVMLVGWSFSYLVEGLSGFGTPAALAAPILVGLGFPALRVAAACLVMNSVPVVFGAVGTPIWFGLGGLGLTDAELADVGRRAAVVQFAVAPVAVSMALALLFPWATVLRRAPHALAVVLASVAGSAIVARFSTEFPSIVGGLCGLGASLALASLRRTPPTPAPAPAGAPDPAPPLSLARAAFPLALTVALLGATRLEPLGLKALLTAESPAARLALGPIGELSVSASLVVRLDDVLGAGASWGMALLYVPFIVPFVVASLASAPLLRLRAGDVRAVWAGTARRLVKPAIALAGALVLVKLMMHGGERAPVTLIGESMADAVGAVGPWLWPAAAPLLGALGSFFSGSATVSNLTFAPVQQAIAGRLGLDPIGVLAMQSVGAAFGNMVCVHNIVAVAAVLGLTAGRRTKGGDPNAPAPGPDPVASILRRTVGPMAACALAAGAAALVLPMI